MMMKKPMTVIGVLALAGTALAATFENPVIPVDWPDPALYRANGRVYSVATGLKTVWSSTNAIDWTDLKVDPLSPRARAALHAVSKHVWAPCVTWLGGRWVLHVSLFVNDADCRVAALVSDGPTGPFENAGEVIDSRAIGIQNTIDPYVLEDRGRVWMFFGSCADGIHRVELMKDGLAVKPGAKPTHVAGRRNPGHRIWGEPGTWEGSFLLRRRGWWYLFVSGGLYTDHTYHLTVGRSRALEGAFRDREGNLMTAGRAKPILSSEKGDRFFGPGHNGEVFPSTDGRDWMFFHCHDATRGKDARPTFLQELRWTKDDWPCFEGGRPKAREERFALAAAADPTLLPNATVLTVDPTRALGPVKPMNAVNNGPIVKRGTDQHRANDRWFRMAEIPYARNHDAAFCNSYGGEHAVDISAVFPNFEADDQDPKSYDFALTDEYLGNIRAVGTRVFYRLGYKIEHNAKKYGIYPPKDFDKWARVCERIVAHYNDGWADGYRWGIEYWEIWNEADLDSEDTWPHDAEGHPVGGRTWLGTSAQYFDLYEKTAKLLKARHPECKIGGPGLAWREPWAREFLAEMARRKAVLDFFSWHAYTRDPMRFRGVRERKWLDDAGFAKTESILDEWNYARDWCGGYADNMRFMQGMPGAAFMAACLVEGQHGSVDMLMYYDARPCGFNGLFDITSLQPLKGYWAFYAWSRLVRLGTAIPVAMPKDTPSLHAVAARSADGSHLGVFIARFVEPGNDEHWRGAVAIELNFPGYAFAACHLTDEDLTFSPCAPDLAAPGRAALYLKPQSFAYVTLEKE